MENMKAKKNVLGGALRSCCLSPKTGYFRDGYCRTDDNDVGKHVICAILTEAFLEFSKKVGNDLSTPRPEYGFPGLKEGDKWCLCALRWKQAWENNVAPLVILESCDESSLEIVPLHVLQKNSIRLVDL